MKILDKDEMQDAEIILQSHLPLCMQVYGFLCSINRNKPHALEVVVDSWPDFQNEHVKEFKKRVSFFCKDEEVFKRMVTEENAIDLSRDLILSFDIRHEPMLKEILAAKGDIIKLLSSSHTLMLSDPTLLPQLNSDIESSVSYLKESHIELVNKTWKFGGDGPSYRTIEHFIRHYPTGCITDDQGQPMCWVVMYDDCASGIMYTLPEHRGRGLAKALISSMSRKVHAQGYPVYCFVDEGHTVSYSLLLSLGFTEDPQHRVGRYQVSSKLDDGYSIMGLYACKL
ncbi:hypothetical protein UPYG_G00050790 [Umbra pygmaea]|uniref:Glycine N-acyltransferase-like protein n=1 Tax=Umbra pygmaea TaxID=75934 RepID=A0ABD0X702_UMBPY